MEFSFKFIGIGVEKLIYFYEVLKYSTILISLLTKLARILLISASDCFPEILSHLPMMNLLFGLYLFFIQLY